CPDQNVCVYLKVSVRPSLRCEGLRLTCRSVLTAMSHVTAAGMLRTLATYEANARQKEVVSHAIWKSLVELDDVYGVYDDLRRQDDERLITQIYSGAALEPLGLH
ncbi:hypothetical protein Vafri_7262, partial [Volvox africanus]